MLRNKKGGKMKNLFFVLFVILGLGMNVVYATGGNQEAASATEEEINAEELNAMREALEASQSATEEEEASSATSSDVESL